MDTALDRSLFPVADRWAYLNHAGVCAPPAPVAEATARAAREVTEQGSLVLDAQEEEVERVRARAATLMGVGPAEVAFVKNTTEGLAFVANGIDWRPGDRVVVPGCEFPSNLYPWLSLRERGVVVDLVAPEGPADALPLDAFARVIAAGPPPRLVATSWVQFGRGWRTDLPALAAITHAAGAMLCVDAIQGLGVLPASFDEWDVDFAAADAHKWLLGPLGIGVFYVRRARLDALRPLEPGWASVADRGDFGVVEPTWDDSARRFEGGSANMASLLGLGAAVDLLLDAGVDQVWRHVDGLCDAAAGAVTAAGGAVLSDRSPGASSGILTFGLPGVEPSDAVAALRGAGVVASPRGGGIRVSPHGFNTTDDIDRLAAALRALRRGRPAAGS